MYPLSRAIGLIAVVLLSVGCSKKRVPAAGPAAPTTVAATDDAARRDSIARAEAARRDSIAREARLREDQEKRLAEARATLATPVYFAYDRSDLSDDARRILEAKAPLMTGSPALRVRLAGHTDERGSDEYNLALGQRRAAAARRHLIALGVPEERLEITSFGEEEPVCQESVESCWSRNRRVEFDITAGADRIVVR